MNDAAGLAANYDDRRYIGGEGRVKRWTRNARSLLGKSVSRISFSYSTIDANFVGQGLLY